MEPTNLGKYRLIAELGHGGMAIVYLAVQSGPDGLGFNKLVVLKRLRADVAEQPDFITMLLDEARLAGRLNHPNVVQTYEVGEVDGSYFIAMEYLDGQPLSRMIARLTKQKKTIPPEWWVTIYAECLTGLHHAHELTDYDGATLDVVHRDVSPHNVFLTYAGQVKVVDFGIAKAAGRASQTQAGSIKGKVAYMAPEQASAEPVDRRTDVFAVGVMLWEALVGRRYWEGVDELSVMKRLVRRELPPRARQVRPDVPAELDAICAKALAPNREDRFATADDMALALNDYLRSSGKRVVGRDIGGALAELFEDRRKVTKEVIESQLAHLKRESQSAFEVRVLGPADSTPSGQIPRGSGSRSALSASRTGPGARPPTPVASISLAADPAVPAVNEKSGTKITSSRPTVSPPNGGGSLTTWLIVAGLVVVAGLATMRMVRTRVAATPPPVVESTTVNLTLRADSPNVTFQIDDGFPVPGPYKGTLPKDHRTHTVVASAPNCGRERRETSADDDITWDFHLTCVGDSSSTSGRRDAGSSH